jgi:hypothetical protein
MFPLTDFKFLRRSGERFRLGMIALFCVLCTPSSAFAYDWYVVAKVTTIEASYLPTKIVFRANTAGGSCAAGSWLTWDGTSHQANPDAQVQSVTAIFSLLLTAKSSNQNIVMFGYNSDCRIQYIYLSDNS